MMQKSYRRIAVVFVLAFPAIASAAEPKALELQQTIALKSGAGRYDHLALEAAHSRLFLANLSNNSLDVVDLKEGKLARQIGGQKKIQGVAYATDLNRIFVGNGAAGTCNVFDGGNYKLLRSIPMPDADNVRYNPTTHLIYVTHAEDAVSAIDGKSLEIKASVKLPGSPESLQIDADRRRLYVNVPNPGLVAVVDLQSHKLLANYPLKSAKGNFPMALDLDGQRIFVGCRNKPCVIALDARSGKELAVIPIPGDIDDLYFDASHKRLYGTCGAGFIAVIRERGANQFELVEKIPTGRMARTGLFDAKTGHLYVIVPRQSETTGPELRVYRTQ